MFPEYADVIFRYPSDHRDPRQDLLVQVRGIFMTLNQLLSEILSLNVSNVVTNVATNEGSNDGSNDGSASDERMIVSSVVLGNGSAPTDLIHVAYVGEGEDLFIIGAPGNLRITFSL